MADEKKIDTKKFVWKPGDIIITKKANKDGQKQEPKDKKPKDEKDKE